MEVIRAPNKRTLINNRKDLHQELSQLIIQGDVLKENLEENSQEVLMLFNINLNEIPLSLHKEINEKIKESTAFIKSRLTRDLTIAPANIVENGFDISTNIEQYKAFIAQLKNTAPLLMINTLKEELLELIKKTGALKTQYLNLKPGVSSMLNVYGWLPSSIPNPNRIDSISEIERIVAIVKDHLEDNGNLKLEFIVDSVSNFELQPQLSQYRNLIHQVNGVILTELSGISGTGSELSKLLKETVSVTPAEEQISKDKYQTLLEFSPRSSVVTDVKTTSLVV